MNDEAEFCLRLGDDALIAAQRLAEWSTRAPDMEEDIALSNIALDQLGVARLLLSRAGELEGAGEGGGPGGLGGGRIRDEDALAFGRDDREFRNCLLAELPNGDFGVSMAKLLFLSAFQWLRYGQLVSSSDEYLSAVAEKARKESAYHLDHAAQWTVRLGDGTGESHRRMQAAVDEVWPYTHELFLDDPLDQRLGLPPSELHPQWNERIEAVLKEATLTRPADGWAPSGGRTGRHTEHLSYLLAEMQVLHRAHPGAHW